MKIEEAKLKVDLDNPVEVTMLSYIGYLEGVVKTQIEKINELETKYNDMKEISEAHRQQVGGLYRQLDER
ncbi:MAG: hypothetical protein II625_01800 [Bacilli bacterium]|nr:hypothetical protein [Bacilli bacterium]